MKDIKLFMDFIKDPKAYEGAFPFTNHWNFNGPGWDTIFKWYPVAWVSHSKIKGSVIITGTMFASTFPITSSTKFLRKIK